MIDHTHPVQDWVVSLAGWVALVWAALLILGLLILTLYGLFALARRARWFTLTLALWALAAALLWLSIACGETPEQLTPHACAVTRATPRPAECATVSPAASTPTPSPSHR